MMKFERAKEAIVDIRLAKEWGQPVGECRIHASDTAAAVYGLGLLIQKLADTLGVPVGQVISILAVALLGPEGGGHEEKQL